ncbi:MAG: hypothetical protein U1E87_06685 [Alphaproteobacteria bacterium]
MARVLGDHQQHEMAEAVLKKASRSTPAQGDVIEQYVAMRLAQCKWPTISAAEGARPQAPDGRHPSAFAVRLYDDPLQLAGAERYSQASTPWARRHTTVATQTSISRAAPARWLRFSDMRDHATGNLMVEAFELHDRQEFEIFGWLLRAGVEGALAASAMRPSMARYPCVERRWRRS